MMTSLTFMNITDTHNIVTFTMQRREITACAYFYDAIKREKKIKNERSR